MSPKTFGKLCDGLVCSLCIRAPTKDGWRLNSQHGMKAFRRWSKPQRTAAAIRVSQSSLMALLTCSLNSSKAWGRYTLWYYCTHVNILTTWAPARVPISRLCLRRFKNGYWHSLLLTYGPSFPTEYVQWEYNFTLHGTLLLSHRPSKAVNLLRTARPNYLHRSCR